MSVQEILIINNGNEHFGISTEDINQISRVPVLMPLPLRPAEVRGLCSISGSVLSMLDLNLLLDMPQVDYENDRSRLLTLNNEYATNALLVSEVYNTVQIDEANIEYLENKSDPVIAIYKYEDMLIQVLSLELLIEKIDRVEIESKEVKQGKIKAEIIKEEEGNRFLIFYMQSEKFALDIEYLQEIILIDKEFTPIIGSSKEVLGLITLRDELLLVIDLRTYYGFEALQSDTNRILIASYQGKRVGLLIDSIIDIKNFLSKNIEYMPNDSSEVSISGVIHDDKSLISFFDHEVLEKIINDNSAYIDTKDEEVSEKNSSESNMEVIVFKLLSKEYAFEIESVDEIIDMISATEVAYCNDLIDGIINIRGQIVTVVSLYKKLHLPLTTNEEPKIIICNVNGNRIGFIVDSVSDILNIDEKDIREQEGELFTNIFHLDDGKRLVLLMDIDNIVTMKDK